jgi:Nucleotide-diphospho-sugar transferase
MVGNGVIFVASGAPYVRAANRAARSVKEHAPSLAVDLFTDAPEAAEEVFDRVHPLEGAHIRSKVDHMHRSRFDRTLYLDTDTRVVGDISDMFAVLDRFDLALAHSHARNRKATRAVWRVEVSDAFPQLNSGVMLFKSSPAVLEFLRDWGKAYHSAGFKKDQVTLRELLWASDLRLHVLPPEYNIRYEKYLRVWDENEAIPRILHFAAFQEGHARKAKRSAKPRIRIRYPLRAPLQWLRRLILMRRVVR